LTYTIFLIVIVSICVFFIFDWLPTDPARLVCSKQCTPWLVEANRHKLGLDVPVLEQWWRFFQGKENLTSTLFFFPSKETVGLTDSFLVQGVIHSFFRLLGFSIINSWSITNIFLLFLGVIGISRAGSHFLKNDTALLGFVLLSSVSYPFVTQLGHIQTLGYLLVFWFVDWYYLIKKGNANQRKRSINLLLISIPLLALSTWYPFALLLLVFALMCLIELIASKEPLVKKIKSHLKISLKGIKNFLSSERTSWMFVSISIGLWGLWFRIYEPAFYALKNHTWGEINFYSPRFSVHAS
jgi:hypothetical protein